MSIVCILFILLMIIVKYPKSDQICVVNYYLDIETTGLDEVESKITTIQYVELERSTGKQTRRN